MDGRARAVVAVEDAVDKLPVQPIKRVIRDPRQPGSDLEQITDQSTSRKRVTRAEADTARTRRVESDRTGTASSQGQPGAEQGHADRSATSATLVTGMRFPSGGTNSGFVAQSLAQEAIGTGLHIEPWTQAIGAYNRSAQGPKQTSSQLGNLIV
ncbi:conserved hypothetical protein [uncultured Gammaproteobacteria bacterium]